MNERLAWTGIVLAGGRSRRFGGLDKSRLPVGGRSLLQRSLDALAPVTTTCLVVGGTSSGDVPSVADQYPGEGPVGGLLTGLAAMTTSHALVVSCDLPFISVALLDALQRAGSNHPLSFIETTDGAMPLCLSVSAEAQPTIAAYWHAGGRRIGALRGLLSTSVVTSVTLAAIDPAGRHLLNVNDPLTYARALAEARHDCAASYFTDLDESKPIP